MDKDNNQHPQQNPEQGSEENEGVDPQEETEREHASTYQPEIHPPGQHTIPHSDREPENQQSQGGADGEKKKVNFDFEKSLNESKGIFKDAIVKPHTLITSNRSISWETSVIIFVLLSLLVGVFAYFSMQNMMENMFGGLGSFMGAEIEIGFLFRTMLGWLATFAVGYFSIYFMLSYFGNNKMDHKLLLTKYVTVNIPFVSVFLVVFILFGFVIIELFMVMYIFALMLFGMIHIYLFLMNVKKPKYDLFWMSSAYLFVLLIATYYITGIDFGIF